MTMFCKLLNICRHDLIGATVDYSVYCIILLVNSVAKRSAYER
jgi:hypothetical protein